MSRPPVTPFRTLLVSLRRELWEHRAIAIAPLSTGTPMRSNWRTTASP